MLTSEIETARILVVDDEPANVLLLQRLLQQAKFTQIKTLTDSRLTFETYESFAPDLILLDLMMPFIDGYTILQRLGELVSPTCYLPVLVLTADNTMAAKRQALTAGAKDFVTKPFDALEVILRVKNLLHTRFMHNALEEHNRLLEARVRERTRELEETQIEILERLARATEYRDDDTGAHTRRVGELSAEIAAMLGLPEDEVAWIRLAAPLHDLGKIGIEDDVLHKPGRLSDAEFAIMQRHARIGQNILVGSRSRLLQLAEEIALTHHEKWDGSGYPDGLSGEAIPLAGRIVAIADVYDALTHKRPYKEAWPIEQAVAEIERLSGRHFDPQVVEAFRRVLASRGVLPLQRAA